MDLKKKLISQLAKTHARHQYKLKMTTALFMDWIAAFWKRKLIALW